MVQHATIPTQRPQRLTFTVPGEAVPQGSLKAYLPRGSKRPVVTSDNPRTRPWRAMVAAAALTAQDNQGTWPVLSIEAIRLDIACLFVRPASVSARKRPHMTVRPDSSKLLRGIEDALTKILWRDDAQVVSTTITKGYADIGAPACTDIQIIELL